MTADGAQADGPSSGAGLSADGRYAAFWSKAPNMGADYFHALLLRDLRTGELGTVQFGAGYYGGTVALSADGRHLGYSAGSRYPNPYVLDRATGTTQRLKPTDPPGGSEISRIVTLSADGGHAAYTATNRHPSSPVALYVRDLAAGTDVLVNPPDAQGSYDRTTGGSLTADGEMVLYGVVKRDGGPSPVYTRDTKTGTVERVEVAPDGSPADASSSPVQLSANGRYAVFNSAATNLVADAPSGSNAYVRDLRTGETRRTGEAGAAARALSGDGKKVLLREADGLRLLDLRNGKRTPVGPAEAQAGTGSVDGRGRSAVFSTPDATLVPDDTNAESDVFLRRK